MGGGELQNEGKIIGSTPSENYEKILCPEITRFSKTEASREQPAGETEQSENKGKTLREDEKAKLRKYSTKIMGAKPRRPQDR